MRHRCGQTAHVRELLSGDNGTVRLRRPVLVGYDKSEASRRALLYAAGLARRMRRQLLVVHVAPACAGEAVVTAYPAPGGAQMAPLLWLIDEVSKLADINDVSVYLAQLCGRRGRSLHHVAAWVHAEALVLGAPQHRWHQVFGSLPAWLVRRARCPVITVP